MKLKDIIVVSLLGVVGFVVSLLSGMITQVFGTYGIFVHVSIGSLLCAPVSVIGYYLCCYGIYSYASDYACSWYFGRGMYRG